MNHADSALPRAPASPVLCWNRGEDMLSRPVLLGVWIVLFQVLAFLYTPAFHTPFVHDDLPNIVYNEDFRAHDAVSKVLGPHPLSTQYDKRPVPGLLTLLNFRLGGLNVATYRAVNLLIHWGAAGLLGMMVWQVARCLGTARPRLLAVAVMVVWAVHPVNSTAVIYVNQRQETLMSFFFLASCVALLAARFQPSRERAWRAASLAGAFLCVLSKENGAGLPVVLAVIDRLFVAGSWQTLWRRHRLYYGTMLSGWGLVGWWVLGGSRVSEWDAIPELASPWRYFQSQFKVLCGYFKLLVWPSPLIFAPVPRIAERVADWLPYGLLLLAGFGGVALAALRRSWLWVPWLVITLVLAPTSSLIPVPLEPAFDYRMHLPSGAALALILAAGWTWTRRHPDHAGVLAGLLATAVVALAAVTRDRAHDYARPESIWIDVVEKESMNYRGWINLTDVLTRQRRFDEARFTAQTLRSINDILKETWLEGEYHRALALIEECQERWSEALAEYQAAFRHLPHRPDMITAQARMLVKLERPEDALAVLRHEIHDTGPDPEARVWEARAWLALGDLDQAQRAAAALGHWQAPRPDLAQACEELRVKLEEAFSASRQHQENP